MSNYHNEIVSACMPILKEAGFHDTSERHERRFVTAYQIWFQLKKDNNPICDILIKKCGGEYVGKDAGSHAGPVKEIASALGRSPDIETQYLDTRFLWFKDTILNEYIKPSGSDCGLFRLR